MPVAGAAVLVLGSSAPAASAACDAPTHTWTSQASTDWNLAANWDAGTVPGATSAVCVPVDPSLVVPQVSGTHSVADLEAPGGLDVSGTLGLSGSGSVNDLLLRGRITGGGVLELIGSAQVTSTSYVEGDTVVRVTDQLTLTPTGHLYLGGAGSRLAVDGLLELQNYSAVSWPFAGEQGVVEVSASGVLRKSGEATSSSLSVPVDSVGRIESVSGTLNLQRPGLVPLGGEVVAAGGEVVVSHPDWVLANGALVDGAVLQQRVGVAAGGVASAVGVELSSADLVGPGTLVLSGGSVATSTSYVTGGVARVPDGGTFTLSPTSHLYVSDPAVVDVRGVLEVQGYAGISWPFAGDPGTVEVSSMGLLRKTGDGTTSSLDQVRLESAGRVEASSGNLRLAGGGTLSGEASAAPGADVSIAGGTFAVMDGTSLSAVSMSSGTVTTSGAVTWADGAISGGRLEGDGLVAATGSWSWSGGEMAGSGRTRVVGAATMAVGGTSRLVEDRRLEVAGHMTLTSTGHLYVGGAGSRLVVEGVVELQAYAGLSWPFAGESGVVEVSASGVLRKSGDGTSSSVGVPVDSAGRIDSVSGTLNLQQPGLSPLGGDVVAAGGEVVLSHPDWVLADGALVDGARLQQRLGVAAGGVASAVGVELASVSLVGPGTLELSGGSVLSSTSYITGGVVKVPEGELFTITGGGHLYMGGAQSRLVVEGVVEVQGYAGISWPFAGEPGTLQVAATGVLRKTGEGTTSRVTVPTAFAAQATARAESGDLDLSLSGGDVFEGTLVGVAPGRVRLVGAEDPVRLGSGVVLDGVTVATDVELVGRVPAQRLTLQSGTLGGTGTLDVLQSLVAESTLGGTATTVVRQGATASFAGATIGDGHNVVVRGEASAATLYLEDGGSLDVRGTLHVVDNTWVQGPGVMLVSGLLHKAAGDGTASIYAVLDNEGEVRVDAGTLTVSQPWEPFNNTGRLLAGTWRTSATLDLPQVRHNSATIVLAGEAASLGNQNPGLQDLVRNTASGTIQLTGGADIAPAGDFANEGLLDLAPGSTVGVTGAFAQSGTGELRVGLADGAGGQVTAGSAALSGWLSLVRASGYEPALDTEHLLVQAPSPAAAFSRTNGLEVAAGRAFAVEPRADGVAVVVRSVPVTGGTTTVAPTTTALPPLESTTSAPESTGTAPATTTGPTQSTGTSTGPTTSDVMVVVRSAGETAYVGKVTLGDAPRSLRGRAIVKTRQDGRWVRVGSVDIRKGRFVFELGNPRKVVRLVILDRAGERVVVTRVRLRSLP